MSSISYVEVTSLINYIKCNGSIELSKNPTCAINQHFSNNTYLVHLHAIIQIIKIKRYVEIEQLSCLSNTGTLKFTSEFKKKKKK